MSPFYDALVSPTDPPGGADFPFGDLSKLFSGIQGGDPWAQAAQIAQGVANEGAPEPNVDPLVRLAILDLARVAELHLGQAPGLRLDPSVKVRPVTRSEWTSESLKIYRPFFERFSEALARPLRDAGTGPDDVDPFGAMFSQMFQAMSPMMVAMGAGSMIGYLGQHALGQYDLPVPRPTADVLLVPSAIDDAAILGGIPVAEMRLWVLIHELTAHAVLSVPHVRARLDALFIDFATAFRLDAPTLMEQFGDITDFAQIGQLAETLNDPDVLFSMMRTSTHELLLPQLDALVAAVLGFVDHTVTRIGRGLVSDPGAIRSLLRHRTTDGAPADRFMERVLGIDITDSTLERGEAFITGIVERAGDEALERLWHDELDLPTAAEVDAPGLWLARIGLDPDLPAGAIDVPDDLSGLDGLD
jgi:putative hydrolase